MSLFIKVFSDYQLVSSLILIKISTRSIDSFFGKPNTYVIESLVLELQIIGISEIQGTGDFETSVRCISSGFRFALLLQIENINRVVY